MPRQEDDRLLVGFANKDDAAVFLVAENLALVQSADFFTPIVDDPFFYGQIAAANALSDIYAMGGQPVTALSLVCFPENGDHNVLEQILAGGMEKMMEANCIVVGGHTVRDSEIKFGYAVTGTVDPAEVWSNDGARPGDRLLLTKPIGTGVIATAVRSGKATREWIESATQTMCLLNRDAASALKALLGSIHSATDITGFGFLGHAWEMAAASRVSLRFDHRKFDFLDGAVECARGGHLAGGLQKNREFIADCLVCAPYVPEEIQQLLFDPQTSGGLLVAVDPKDADAACKLLEERGCRCMRVGEVVGKTTPLLEVF
ncbi:MAG: selenide, water dikinase SelD [Acidobacteria bacterium]|nr:selenide, water dikinase SelD [Acidobacteriota bacterium]